jgi:hypothetical protein
MSAFERGISPRYGFAAGQVSFQDAGGRLKTLLQACTEPLPQPAASHPPARATGKGAEAAGVPVSGQGRGAASSRTRPESRLQYRLTAAAFLVSCMRERGREARR